MSLQHALETMQQKVGTELQVGDWLTLTQERIDAFADATGDHQWIHTDPERARRESPYGATIAHGYLTLSLYPMLRGMVAGGAPLIPGARSVINYGLNKVRFPAPLRVGARVRARTALVGVTEVKGTLEVITRYTAEVEGEERPACVAEAIMRYVFREQRPE